MAMGNAEYLTVYSVRNIKFAFIVTVWVSGILTLAVLMNSQTAQIHNSNTRLYETLISTIPGEHFTYDANIIASFRHSTIEILGDRRVYNVGDKVKVRITLYDQLGRRKTTGGDILRLWLAEGKVKANVAGEVIDNQDGTYTGRVLLPWRGRPRIHVSIAVSRELRMLITKIIEHNNGSFLAYDGQFFIKGSEGEVESTPCGPLFLNVDRTHLCNFTDENYGLEWYCIAPQKPGLSCKDWNMIKSSKISDALSETEGAFYKKNHDLKFRRSPCVSVIGDDAVMATGETPCDRRPRQETWSTRPSGFYFNKTWNINGCRRGSTHQDHVTFHKYGSCLNNRHLIFIGDSNIRLYTDIFSRYLNLTLIRGSLRARSVFTFVVDTIKNISLSCFPHSLPYYFNGFNTDRHSIVSVTKRLDDIPAGNNSIVLLHLWLHTKMMDARVFRSHVRQIRISAERMLQRAPDVDLFIKGPHATTSHNPPTDFSIQQHKRIWREEFQGIHDKVIFLDMWDMTVGNENHKSHPNCILDMVFLFLVHLCSI